MMRKLDLLQAVVRDIGLSRTTLESGALVVCSALWPSILSIACGSAKMAQDPVMLVSTCE
jgi:hypothetical protein